MGQVRPDDFFGSQIHRDRIVETGHIVKASELFLVLQDRMATDEFRNDACPAATAAVGKVQFLDLFFSHIAFQNKASESVGCRKIEVCAGLESAAEVRVIG